MKDLFAQDPKQFFGSKTNYAGMFMIGAGVYGLVSGNLTQEISLLLLGNGCAALGLKDSNVKTQK